jgi:hypothetical protein
MTASTSDAALDAVRRRDELLSLLYWLRADRLNDAPTAADLAPFMGAAPWLDGDLRALCSAGLVEPELVEAPAGAAPRYRLTAAGRAEGQRRFEEDFHPVPDDGTAGNAHEVMLGVCGPNAKCVKEGTHGECAEPAPSLPSAGRP